MKNAAEASGRIKHLRSTSMDPFVVDLCWPLTSTDQAHRDSCTGSHTGNSPWIDLHCRPPPITTNNNNNNKSKNNHGSLIWNFFPCVLIDLDQTEWLIKWSVIRTRALLGAVVTWTLLLCRDHDTAATWQHLSYSDDLLRLFFSLGL